MKYVAVIILVLVLVGFQYYSKKKNNIENQKKLSFYELKSKTLQDEEFDFSSLKGKKVMIVNTASKCGLTPQYEGLEKLYKTYKNKDFVIVGFPSNDFLFQEPGGAEEIASFCKLNYGVTFPMMQKIKVKGSKKDVVYQFLTKKENNGLKDSKVKWNFQKYLINEEGVLEKVISPKTKPNDSEIINWIEGK